MTTSEAALILMQEMGKGDEARRDPWGDATLPEAEEELDAAAAAAGMRGKSAASAESGRGVKDHKVQEGASLALMFHLHPLLPPTFTTASFKWEIFMLFLQLPLLNPSSPRHPPSPPPDASTLSLAAVCSCCSFSLSCYITNYHNI